MYYKHRDHTFELEEGLGDLGSPLTQAAQQAAVGGVLGGAQSTSTYQEPTKPKAGGAAPQQPFMNWQVASGIVGATGGAASASQAAAPRQPQALVNPADPYGSAELYGPKPPSVSITHFANQPQAVPVMMPGPGGATLADVQREEVRALGAAVGHIGERAANEARRGLEQSAGARLRKEMEDERRRGIERRNGTEGLRKQIADAQRDKERRHAQGRFDQDHMLDRKIEALQQMIDASEPAVAREINAFMRSPDANMLLRNKIQNYVDDLVLKDMANPNGRIQTAAKNAVAQAMGHVTFEQRAIMAQLPNTFANAVMGSFIEGNIQPHIAGAAIDEAKKLLR